jgi:2-polyprenyl-6-methoxyphenol hydroxylase-like FAD-dependent oxidoreductase
MSSRPRALVVGGYVGGLFAAHLLRSVGWDVEIFERSVGDLASRGAGIGAADALFAVIQRIAYRSTPRSASQCARASAWTEAAPSSPKCLRAAA